jgi:undecaprenyl-diphosphatase
MEELNQSIFLQINYLVHSSNILDNLAILSAKYMPYFFILLEIILYFILKKKNSAIFAFMSMVLALTFNKLIGMVYFHSRPFVDNLGVTLVNHLPDNSFPSDHTTFIFAIAIFSYINLDNKNIGEVALILALIGGVSRIFTGVHYPFDILGGILVALISSLIIYKLKVKLQFINNFIFKIEKSF